MIRMSGILVLVCLMGACMSLDKPNNIGTSIRTNVLNAKYDIHFPKIYDPNRSRGYPVIYIFHPKGISDNNRDQIWKMLDKMSIDGVIDPVIAIVVSKSRNTEHNIKNSGLHDRDIMQEAINYVDSHYNSLFERDGRYLVGGNAAVIYALNHPNLFKSMVMLGFSSLFNVDNWNKRSFSTAISEYTKQSTRVPFYIVSGNDLGEGYNQKVSLLTQKDSVNRSVHAVQLYQQLHKVNLFKQDFEKYNDVPANPAELRVIHGKQGISVWLKGFEEGVKYFFDKAEDCSFNPRYDKTTYQTSQKGIVFSKSLKSKHLATDKLIGNDELPYKIYLPYSYNPQDNTHYPVLYLLHGSGGSETSWDEFWPILNLMIEHKMISPLIAVAPITGNSYWVDSNKYGAIESAIIRELISEIDSSYHSISKKAGRGIIGFSMGGYGALRYSFVYPELFSSAVLLSPAIQSDDVPITSGAVIRGSFGDPFNLSKWNALNYPKALQSYLAQKLRVPMYIITGDDEWNHMSEKDDLPNDAFRYNMEVQAMTLYQQLYQYDPDLGRYSHSPAQLNIVNGGHNIDVWSKGFKQGVEYLFSNGLSASH